MLEKEIEKILVTEVKKLGGKAYKFVSPGNSGVPDRIVIFPKKPPGVCGIENGHRRAYEPADCTGEKAERTWPNGGSSKGDSRIDQIFREIRISASEHSTFRKIQRGENRWSLNHTAIRNTVLKRSSR